MPIESVTDQHWEAALGLALQRAAAVREWHYSLNDLLALDNKLSVHREALLGSGILNPTLANSYRGAYDVLFVATLLTVAAQPDSSCLKLLHDMVSTAGERTAFSDALAWHEWGSALGIVDSLLETEDPDLQLAGLRAIRLHRQSLRPELLESLGRDVPEVAAERIRMISELALPGLAAVKFTPSPKCGDVAERTICEAILLRFRIRDCDGRATAAVECLRKAVLQHPANTGSAAQLLMCVLQTEESREIIQELGCGSEVSVRLAVQCAGWLGIPDSIPWLLQMMSQPEFARVAGESFYRITGLRLDQRPYEGDWPDGFEAGPNDDPEDENVEMDEDENLPWPEPGPIAEWWEQNRSRFKSNVRYLLGFELDNEEWLRKVLVLGRQRERATAASELAIRNPTEPLFNVEEHGRRQMKKLGVKRLPTEEYRCNHIEAGPDDHTWKKYLLKKK